MALGHDLASAVLHLFEHRDHHVELRASLLERCQMAWNQRRPLPVLVVENRSDVVQCETGLLGSPHETDPADRVGREASLASDAGGGSRDASAWSAAPFFVSVQAIGCRSELMLRPYELELTRGPVIARSGAGEADRQLVGAEDADRRRLPRDLAGELEIG